MGFYPGQRGWEFRGVLCECSHDFVSPRSFFLLSSLLPGGDFSLKQVVLVRRFGTLQAVDRAPTD